MLTGYQVIAIPADIELRGHKVAAPGNVVRVIDVPGSVALHVSVTGSDPVRMQPGDTLRDCGDGWTELYITTHGRADGNITLFVARDVELAGASGDGVAYGMTAAGTRVPMLVAEGGQLYVRLADRLVASLDSVTVRTAAAQYWDALAVRAPEPEQVRGEIAAGDNDAGLRIESHIGGRHRTDILVVLGDAADIAIEVSFDGLSWREIQRESVSAGVWHRSLETAYPWVAVVVPTTAVDVVAEIVA